MMDAELRAAVAWYGIVVGAAPDPRPLARVGGSAFLGADLRESAEWAVRYCRYEDDPLRRYSAPAPAPEAPR